MLIDDEHRIYDDVLSFKNVMWSYQMCVNVILYVLLRKLDLSDKSCYIVLSNNEGHTDFNPKKTVLNVRIQCRLLRLPLIRFSLTLT
jgi:hypothetical protein